MKTNKLFMSGIAAAVVAVAAYGFAALYYSSHFMDNTYINDINCSGYTVGDVLREMSLTDNSQILKIVGKDGAVETINCKDFGYSTSAKEEIEKIMEKQNELLWISSLDIFGGDENNNYLELTVSYNESELQIALDSLDMVINGTQESTNATIVSGPDGYYIQDEIIGNIIDKEKLQAAVKKNLENGNLTINLMENKCYALPSVTADNSNLIKSLENIKTIEDVVITYDFKDRKEVVDKEKIKNWLVIDSDGNITLDDAAVSLFINQLCYKYDTYLTDRQFTTTAGNTITVGGGIYGWQIYKSEETEALKKLILSGTSETRQPIYYIEGYERGEDDIGKTYIEIDLTTQHLWYYKSGELFLESDVISGYPYNGHSTPTGVFCVWSREKDRQLVGETYNTHVDYWMPINWDGVGLHDAWWQTSFGGEVYKTPLGSHGCINLPTNIAEQIYNNVEIRTPVVIYES